MRSYHLLLGSLLVAVALQGRDAKAQDDDEDSDRRDSICTASLDRGRVNGTLNVVGPCELTRADVRGDVILFAGGSLIVRGGRIRGSVEGNRADFVDLGDVRVDGNVSLQELVGDSSSIESSDIRGNLVLAGNRSRFEIVDNELRRDVTALGNTGGLQIASNTISGDLDCSGNAPAPTLLGNRIEGDADGQCAAERVTEPPREDPPAPAPAPTPRPSTPPPPAASPPSTPTPTPTASPPPAAPAPPAAATPPAPAATPPAAAPPAATPPAAAPPAAAPPEATPPATTPPAVAAPPLAADPSLVDDGGAGAIGWPMIALLLPLLALRRRRLGGRGSVQAR